MGGDVELELSVSHSCRNTNGLRHANKTLIQDSSGNETSTKAQLAVTFDPSPDYDSLMTQNRD